MHIGVLKEIKEQEYRVSMTPASARELIRRGHIVLVEKNVGSEIGFSNEMYQSVGAKIIETAEEIFASAELLVKVKEPQPPECKKLRENQLLFSFLHLAPDPKQADLLLASGCVAIAYETVTDEVGGLPLLTPMSEIAGRLSVQAGARCLEKLERGRGILLGGVSGVAPAKVVILGGGVAGTEASRIALGMGANVVVLDKSLRQLRKLDNSFNSKITTICASSEALEDEISTADLVIGAVLVPGALTPKLISRALLRKMRPGSAVVDVSIDQGGCFETSRTTTHSSPTYMEEGVIHYCVGNIPSSVPWTATLALNNATLPFIIALAEKGHKAACLEDPHLLDGVNICKGQITNKVVALDLKKPYTPAEQILKNNL